MANTFHALIEETFSAAVCFNSFKNP
jgi:hypothetical protein